MVDYVTFNGKDYKTRDVRLEEYKVTVKVAEEPGRWSARVP